MPTPYTTTFLEDLERECHLSLAKDPKARLAVDPYAVLLVIWRLREAQEPKPATDGVGEW